jgi:hypothetical protein
MSIDSREIREQYTEKSTTKDAFSEMEVNLQSL